jgi:predicted dehydrogenase
MATQRLGIIMHGVTGRMGMNQHLIRSIVAIRNQGGVTLANGDRVMPDPILIGRNADKIEALAKAHGVARWGTDLDAALANPDDTVFFDAGTTQMRPTLLARPCAPASTCTAKSPSPPTWPRRWRSAAEATGQRPQARRGAGQAVPARPAQAGHAAPRRLLRPHAVSVRIEFGYWVFEGDLQPIQRPSWNYRAEDGGGIILDMVCHWRYVLDNLFGEVQSVSCLGATHIPKRWDEAGQPYAATADDAAYATFELKGTWGEPVVAQVNSSWTTRVRRDDLVTFHVDGTHGSAVAGLQDCRAQSRVATPARCGTPTSSRP